MKRRPRSRHSRRDENVRHLSILDLGAFAVKALVVELENGAATIVGRGQAQHMNGVSADGLLGDLEAWKTTCEEALCDAEDATEKTCGRKIVPDSALIAAPTAWLCGALGTGQVERWALETPISVDEYGEPLFRAGRRALRNLGRVTGAGKWGLLDAALMTFGVNGNPVTDPAGFRGHILSATAFVVAVYRAAPAALRQLADALQLEPPTLVAEPLALARAAPGDGLIVQIGSATTALVLTRSGTPLAFGSVPLAGGAWIRTLVDKFHFSPARADAALRAWSGGKLNARHAATMQQALQPAFDAWFEALIETLQSWKGAGLTWAPNIYLCGGASAVPGVSDLVARARWLDALPFPYTPQVSAWDGSNVSLVKDATESRWLPDGVTTLSLAAWALRAQDKQKTDHLLRALLEIP